MSHLSTTCPVCCGSEITVVGKPVVSQDAERFVRHDYRVVKCTTCRFYFIFPEIDFTQAEWQALYNSEYFEVPTPWWGKKKRFEQRKHLDLLERHSTRHIRRFLDIGCGEGHVLKDALERNWIPYGVDIADNRIESARDGRITFVTGDVFRTPFPDDFFDAVYMNSVLEHVADPLRHLREISRILMTGGLLHVGTPNEDCLFNTVKQGALLLSGRGDTSARLTPFKTPYHVSGFTRESITRALEETSFEIVRLRNFAGEYEWRKHEYFTKAFFIHFGLLPVHLLAIPLRQQIYFDVLARKTE